MANLSRRNFIQAAGAAATLPMLGGKAMAQEKVKVGFAYLGVIGDAGWTWAHEKGRKAMVAALGDKVEAIYVENVAEDPTAIPVFRDLAQQGCKLIFGCTFGHQDPVLQVASEFPDVKFETCTGYITKPNVTTYNGRFHEGRAVLGTISGKMSKTGNLGYLGSIKVPEVVLGVNSFLLSAQAQNPAATLKLVFVDSWYDPPKEASNTETLINLGCDIITTHTDSPAALQVMEQHGIFGFGQDADMSRFAPNAHLTAIEDIWGPYYLERVQALIDGTWKEQSSWEGIKKGLVVISPYNPVIPPDVVAAAEKVRTGWIDGSYNVFKGPIYDQAGTLRVKEGEAMTDEQMLNIDWYVKGVESAA